MKSLGIRVVIFWGVAGMINLLGCAAEPTIQNDALYFPQSIGNFWIYEVEEVVTSRNSCGDDGEVKSTYELKVEIINTVAYSSDETLYVMERSKREAKQNQWVTLNSWSVRISNNKILVSEGNTIFVKFLLPVSEGASWNGNMFNNTIELSGLHENQYQVLKYKQPFTTSLGTNYKNTITVIQSEEENNIIYRDIRKEVYAYEIGLVYKETIKLNYFSNSQLSCYGQNRIQKGVVYKQTLKEYKI